MDTKKLLKARNKVQYYAHQVDEHFVNFGTWVARNVWKRYFGIETPLYKMWWEEHKLKMQKELDIAHSDYPLFFII